MPRYRLLAVMVACVVLLLGVALLVHDQQDTSKSRVASARNGAQPSAFSSKGGSAKSEIAPVQTLPEGLPSSGAPSGLPGLTKQKRHSTGALVKAPLPKAASRRGALVRGYPKRIVPVAPRSNVRSSSVSPGVRSLQVALDAKVSASGDDVLRFYTLRLGRWGFASSSAPAVGGSNAVTFKRGEDALVVTVTPATKKSCRYTVFGTLHSVKS